MMLQATVGGPNLNMNMLTIGSFPLGPMEVACFER